MKYILMFLTALSLTACMKSKDEYKQAISEVKEQQESEEIQREEERNDSVNPQRARGSNDAEGMGMDE